MKHKLTITTILPDVRYTQLALYNLKAYALKYSRFSRMLDIRLYEIEADRHQYVLGATYPVLSRKSLVRHAIAILKGNPRIVGFSVFMWNIDLTLRLCRIIKAVRPDTTLILGGPEASADPAKILAANRAVDMVVRDEGEATFTETVDRILSGEQDYSVVKGLFYREKTKIVENEYRPPLDLATIPSPYLTGLIDLEDKKSFALETSRGCPFHCAYCTYSIRGYHQLRFFPLSRILSEIKLVLSRRRRKVRIMDDNFNINPVRTAKILRQIGRTRHRSDIKVFLNSSMWEVDDRLARLLKKCDIVCSVGVQSIDDRVLKLINRGNKLPILENNLRKFDQYGIKYELSFIMGLPGENYDQIKDSLNWAFRYHPREINLFPLMIFKGTYLNTHAKRLGLVAYGKPFYIIRTNKTLPAKLVRKGIGLKESIGLLYNKGLLHNTIRMMALKLNMPFTSIIEELEVAINADTRNRTPMGLQKSLIRNMIQRHPQLRNLPGLQESMNDDLHYYSGN